MAHVGFFSATLNGIGFWPAWAGPLTLYRVLLAVVKLAIR